MPSPRGVEVSKDNTTNVATSSANLPEEAEQPGATEKEKNANQGVAPDAMKPPTTAQDPPAEKEAPKTMEIILATMPLSAKFDPASQDPEASEATSTQPINGPSKEKLVIKKKQALVQFFFSCYLFLLFLLLLLATSVLIPKVCKKVAYFVLYLPCLKALINESYVYFLSSYDSHFDIDITSSYLKLNKRNNEVKPPA